MPAAEPRGEDLARRIEVTQIGAREAAADVAVDVYKRQGFELITSRTSSPVPLLRKSLAILLSSLIIFVFSCGLAGNAGHVSQIKFRFFYRPQSPVSYTHLLDELIFQPVF